MRFSKLFLAVWIALMPGLMARHARAASPATLCDATQIEALHADRHFPLRDHAMMMHAGSGQIALSRIARDQKSARLLSEHDTLLLFERLATHDPTTYAALATRVLFAAPLKQASAAHHNMIYLGLADAEAPSSPDALAPRIRALFDDPPADTHGLMTSLCARLPAHITMERVHVHHDMAGTSWQIALREQSSDEQIGVLAVWLDATQTDEAIQQTWLEWGGSALLVAVMALMAALIWRRRARKAKPAWREDAHHARLCPACISRPASHHQRCAICVGLHDTHDLVHRAHLHAIEARRELLLMLLELDALAQAAQRLWASVFGSHQRVAQHARLYNAQTQRVAEMASDLHAQWFSSTHDLWQILGLPRKNAPAFIAKLEELLRAEAPEFVGARAPEPWMSHLSELYTLLDVVALELELRQRPADSLLIVASAP